MATLSTNSRAMFEEWLQDIADEDLRLFVFSNASNSVDFGSNDFVLVYCGLSNGEPLHCHMIEVRVNMNTEDKQLTKLFKTTTSLAKDRTRLAFALFPTSLEGHCKSHHVRQALQTSPVEGKMVINKVHIRWSPSVTWDGDRPSYKGLATPFDFEKIPFEGLKVDGTPVKKKGKTEKLS